MVKSRNKKIVPWEKISVTEKVERWENALRVLKFLPPEVKKKHFDMASWGYTAPECGTNACAAGYCGMHPWFIERGLELLPEKISKSAFKKGEMGIGIFKGYSVNSSPVGLFFGHKGANKIFYDGTDRSVTQVMKEIRNHIKDMKRTISDYEKLMKKRPDEVELLMKHLQENLN